MQRHITNSTRRTLTLFACFLFFLFALLIAQFFKIQLIEGEKWTQIGSIQHYFVIKEPFKRGIFYSGPSSNREHPEEPQPLVVDIEKFHLYIDPLSIPAIHKEKAASQLIALLGLPQSKQAVFREQFAKKSRSRKLMMWLEEETRNSILNWWNDFAKENRLPRNALFFISDFQRSYPFGKLLGQILHTVQMNKEEATNQAIPTGGLELYFHSYLKGKEGKKKMMRSPHNALETGETVAAPEHGTDIYLTINHTLQAIVEEELEKGVKQYQAKGGWAVMMDPRTGEILALGQYPFFYPPDYPKYFNDPKLIEHTRVKAVTDANEPGSVIKPMALAIALKANDVLKKKGAPPLFHPEEKVATSSGRFPGRTKEMHDGRTHLYMDMFMALQKSANIYPAKIIQRVIETFGDNWFRNELITTFGISEKTGIELPSETRGVLPLPGKMHPNGTLEWSKPTPYSLAIGHNLQMNSIQLVRAFSVFANGGYLVTPTLVRKMVKNHEVLLDNTKNGRSSHQKKVLSDDIIALIINGLKYVTKPRGSAPAGDVWGYTEVGKSGTAEKIVNGVYSKNSHVSSFIGFTPIDHPAFVLLVTLDEPAFGFLPGIGKNHMGGTCCSPIFRTIAARALEYLGVKPDDPYGYPVGDPRYNENKAHWKIESRRLQEKYEKWNNIRGDL